MLTLKIIFWVIIIFIIYQFIIRLGRKTVHFPAPAFIGRLLDSNMRRWAQPPAKLIERSGISTGLSVLEVGCGSGAFLTFVARAVGARGKVYGLDIQKKMLDQVRAKLARPEFADIKNIELIKASAYQIPLPNNSLDVVYFVTVLQEIPDRQKALIEARRVLKPGGYLAVTEILPDPDYALKSIVIKQGLTAGFMLDRVLGNFWNYTVRFKK